MAIVAASVAALLALGGTAAEARRLAHPATKRISMLYVVTARSGYVAGSRRHLTVTLRGLARNAVWFSDRPAHQAGSLPGAAMASEWRGFGFTASPPNAALVYTDPRGAQHTVIVELRHPRFDAGADSLTLAARWVNPRSAYGGDLDRQAHAVDQHPSRRMIRPSLFIDDTSAPVYNGCVLQPYTTCINSGLDFLELSNTDLTGADLEGVQLVGASLTGDNFTAATLLRTSMIYGDLRGSNFNRAEIAFGSISDEDLDGVNLSTVGFSSETMIDDSTVGTVFTGASGCLNPGSNVPVGPLVRVPCGPPGVPIF